MVTTIVETVFCDYCRSPTKNKKGYHLLCYEEMKEAGYFIHDPKTCGHDNIKISLWFREGKPVLFTKHFCDAEDTTIISFDDIIIVGFDDHVWSNYPNRIIIRAQVMGNDGESHWITLKSISHSFMSTWTFIAIKIIKIIENL